MSHTIFTDTRKVFTCAANSRTTPEPKAESVPTQPADEAWMTQAVSSLYND